MHLITPSNFLVKSLRWELQYLLTSFEVGNYSAIVLSSTDDETRIRDAPGERKDATVVNVIECGNWVTWVTKIPNIDGRVLVIIVGYDELCWHLRIPHHLCFLWSSWLLSFLSSKVVIHTSRA